MAKCANIPMDTCIIANITTMQRCGCYANISMNESTMVNVATMQHRRFYGSISMSTLPMVNVLTTQLGTSCVFDSPGLARNEPTLGKRSQGDSTP